MDISTTIRLIAERNYPEPWELSLQVNDTTRAFYESD